MAYFYKIENGNGNKSNCYKRPILQLNKNKEIIKRYDSIAEAARAMNGTSTFIRSTALEPSRTAYGFYWRFE